MKVYIYVCHNRNQFRKSESLYLTEINAGKVKVNMTFSSPASRGAKKTNTGDTSKGAKKLTKKTNTTDTSKGANGQKHHKPNQTPLVNRAHENYHFLSPCPSPPIPSL